MFLQRNQLVLSASDLVDHVACPHLTTLNREVALGLRERPVVTDPGAAIVRRYGDAHEQAVLAGLRSARTVVEVPRHEPAVAEQLTRQAMTDGAEVIYQAALFDGRWLGYADFLLRNDSRPSSLGAWSYDIADTKLARRVKVEALVQMAVYARQLERVQGVAPANLTVILGSGEHVAVPYSDVAAYAHYVSADYERWLADSPDTYPVRVPRCSICPWALDCEQQWRTDDDLLLVSNLRRAQRQHLRDGGIATVSALATAGDDHLTAVTAVGATTKRRLADQARLQVEARNLDSPPYEPVLPVEPGCGLTLLPEPDPGDLFLDLEGDPFHGDHGLEYLWGISDAADEFTARWAHDPEAERTAFESTVDHILAAWRRHPGMHVYHYAPYEPSRLKQLSQRYGSRVDEVDALLRGERLVDLYTVARQGMRIGVESYSIKALELLYSPDARVSAEVKDAAASIVEYERWRESGDPSIVAAIEAYNRDDCVSTRRLRDWLEARRGELVANGHDVPRPVGAVADVVEHQRPADPEVLATEADLMREVPESPDLRDGEQHAKALLASLLEWHRRESRAEWWEYFRVRTLTSDELVDDPAALGGLAGPVQVRTEKRSGVWRYQVPPQECRLRLGAQVEHAGGDRARSTVVGLDLEQGWVELKRALNREDPHPTGLLPSSPIPTDGQAATLLRVGRWVAQHGVAGPGPYRAVRDLLLHRPPALEPAAPLRRPGEDGAAALCRLAPVLHGLLPVQGPPGSGKTYAGSHAVVELIRAGRTVGICAPSHRVITNLLDAVMLHDDRGDQVVRPMQKPGIGDADDSDTSRHPRVVVTNSNQEIEEALAAGRANLVAGTTWLFVRDDVTVDVLVVDEAGQFSLANAVAAGASATGIILLGDPQQLPQPVHGVHPPGADASALEHVLAGHDTMPPDHGLFLDTTRRMHPQVCEPVSTLSYEGRLHSYPGLENQLVGGDDDLAGAGLRWYPVQHVNRSVDAPEEAAVVASLVDRLVGRPWTDEAGATRPLCEEDLLVVAPYNAQVARLLAALPDRVRVGTVDKFQGQEAPVVIVSLTTSSAADAPRGVEFVANRNRLNVAVSRARSLAVVVGSPGLLSSPVWRLDQLCGLNALCHLVQPASSPA